MRLGAMLPPGANQVMPLQDVADRARRRPVRTRISLRENITYCFWAVFSKSSLYGEDIFDHLRSDPERVREPSSRAVTNAADAIFSESPEPLMTGLLANPVTTTELDDRLFAFEAVEDKS